MSRPKGSEVITVDRLRQALVRVRQRRREPLHRPSRVALAMAAGFMDSGVRDFHLRRGLSYSAFLDELDKTAVSRVLCLACGRDDCCMRILIDLDPAIAERVLDLAHADRRHPRDEVAVLVAEALRRRQSKRPEGPRTVERVA